MNLEQLCRVQNVHLNPLLVEVQPTQEISKFEDGNLCLCYLKEWDYANTTNIAQFWQIFD